MEVSKKDTVVPQRHIKLQEQTGPYNDTETRDHFITTEVVHRDGVRLLLNWKTNN
jgi:hypothetical protein